MAISIAEYLGQRTDTTAKIAAQIIQPKELRHLSASCPFNNTACSKMSMQSEPKHPVCSLRRSDGQFYMVCEHRLLSTKYNTLSHYQAERLLEATRFLFNDELDIHQLGFKREVSIKTGEDNFHKADFVFALLDDNLPSYGPRRLIVEVQGGGETNNTGQITGHINRWIENPEATNEFLARNVPKAGTIQTNAWRRLQEQLFVKATSAKKTHSDYGFAVLMGEVIVEYICEMMPELLQKALKRTERWDVAFVVYSEVRETEIENLQSVTLAINTEKSLFLRLEDLFAVMVDRGKADPHAFSGNFHTLDGNIIHLDV